MPDFFQRLGEQVLNRAVVVQPVRASQFALTPGHNLALPLALRQAKPQAPTPGFTRVADAPAASRFPQPLVAPEGTSATWPVPSLQQMGRTGMGLPNAVQPQPEHLSPPTSLTAGIEFAEAPTAMAAPDSDAAVASATYSLPPMSTEPPAVPSNSPTETAWRVIDQPNVTASAAPALVTTTQTEFTATFPLAPADETPAPPTAAAPQGSTGESSEPTQASVPPLQSWVQEQHVPPLTPAEVAPIPSSGAEPEATAPSAITPLDVANSTTTKRAEARQSTAASLNARLDEPEIGKTAETQRVVTGEVNPGLSLVVDPSAQAGTTKQVQNFISEDHLVTPLPKSERMTIQPVQDMPDTLNPSVQASVQVSQPTLTALPVAQATEQTANQSAAEQKPRLASGEPSISPPNRQTDNRLLATELAPALPPVMTTALRDSIPASAEITSTGQTNDHVFETKLTPALPPVVTAQRDLIPASAVSTSTGQTNDRLPETKLTPALPPVATAQHDSNPTLTASTPSEQVANPLPETKVTPALPAMPTTAQHDSNPTLTASTPSGQVANPLPETKVMPALPPVMTTAQRDSTPAFTASTPRGQVANHLPETEVTPALPPVMTTAQRDATPAIATDHVAASTAQNIVRQDGAATGRRALVQAENNLAEAGLRQTVAPVADFVIKSASPISQPTDRTALPTNIREPSRQAPTLMASQPSAGPESQAGAKWPSPFHNPQSEGQVNPSLVRQHQSSVHPANAPAQPSRNPPAAAPSQIAPRPAPLAAVRIGRQSTSPARVEPAAELTIRVTIGRVEVRQAAAPSPTPSRRRTSPPVLSLDTYLARTQQGRS